VPFKLKDIDISIVLILLAFLVISTLAVHSATVNDPKFVNMAFKNLINYVIGFAVFFGVSILNYKPLLKAAFYFYIFGIVLLVSVLLFGQEINGAKSWFTIPIIHFDFQPAEFVKILLIIALAYFLARREGEPLHFIYDIVPVFLIIFIPFTLVMLQPDLGNAVIYIVITIGMLWIANIRLQHVIIGIVSAALLLGLFLFVYSKFHEPIVGFLQEHDKGHWAQRVDTFLYPDQVSADASYQVENSISAIGSGSFFGSGYLQGNLIQQNFVPYPYSDSIFVVIGEEFGFLGVVVVLLIYFALIFRLMQIAHQTEDLRGKYVIIGIVSMFVFQVFENVGMLMGIMPLTGITLPFISYGGTSLFLNMLSLGLVMSIKMKTEDLPDHIS
jgi:rod shape determining protein RodA